MRRFLADIHMHTDYNVDEERWHGMPPATLAEAIVQSPLDVVAITEHNRVHDRYFDVREEIARLTEGTGREILTILGMELTVTFEGNRYHVGYLYEETFERGNLPETPEATVNVRHLEQYRTFYPGVAIFEHPTWKAGCRSDMERVRALMESGLVDGAELINGAVLANNNGRGKGITGDAWRLFIEARKKQQLAPIGSSDAHKPHHIGLAATAFDADEPESLFRAIRKGSTRAVALHESVARNIHDLLTIAGINRFIETE